MPLKRFRLTHLCRVGSSALSLWLSPFPNWGCLAGFCCCRVLLGFLSLCRIVGHNRPRVLRRLSWVCTVCSCPSCGTLGLSWLTELTLDTRPHVSECFAGPRLNSYEVITRFTYVALVHDKFICIRMNKMIIKLKYNTKRFKGCGHFHIFLILSMA